MAGDGRVSRLGDTFGVRFDEEQNDLAAVIAGFAEAGADVEGVLVVFTTFDDRGAAGPAYHVPLFDDVEGTGRERLDQRAELGATRLEGVVNMKRLDDHAEVIGLLAHEVAHRHLARMRARVDGSPAPLLGRQGAHWHALMHSDASLLGGHAFVESRPGRFVVAERNLRFFDLDLYALGLLPQADVRPWFIIVDGTTEEGFRIPEAAELGPGEVVLGSAQPVTIADVLEVEGPRRPAWPDAPRRLRLRYGLLTAPGESVTSTAVLATAGAIDDLRRSFDEAWPTLTRGRGRVCSTVDGCEAPEPEDEPAGCACRTGGRGSASGMGWGLAGWVLAVGARALGRARPREPEARPTSVKV